MSRIILHNVPLSGTFRKKKTKTMEEENFVKEFFDLDKREIPVKIQLKVITTLDFIDLITELGYRENKEWEEHESETWNKLNEEVNKHVENLMKEFKIKHK